MLFLSNLQAQDLYEPRNMKLAYENDTRSRTGEPGTNYWQNRGEYSINITATPPDRMIKGSEDITYSNNSPDTLNYLVFKFFLNRHKPGAARNYGASQEDMTSGMHVDSLSVNGISQSWRTSSRPSTIQRLRLTEGLAPGESVQIHFNWHYEISLTSGREGMIDSTTYFLAYFYPRVSVLDDYMGWDTIEFTGSQEFYSDFNDYTVIVTVPKNYVVWGTGTLKNPDEVLQNNIAQRFNKSLSSDEISTIASFEEMTSGKVTAQSDLNTWSFEATNIPDMAFGISDHFVWDASSVVVDDETNRRASVQAAYNDTSADYHQMVGFGRQILNWFSNDWPGIAYPYEKTSIFQGYAGMEYPMMANDETYGDPAFSQFVAAHEIAHTYFPFYMGVNETRYAFMDEGWAATFELLINRHNMGVETADKLFRQFRINRWIHTPSTASDMPIITPADMVSRGYGNNAYGKPALGYLAIKDMLGDELFKTTLHGYMERWNGKHPSPWDFFYSFNDLSGQDLNWFWKPWYFENSYIDLALTNVKKSRKKYTLSIQNIGGMPAPVDVEITYADGSTEIKHQTSSIWKENQQKTTVEIKTKKTITSIKLNGGIWMDADLSNNSWTK